MSRYKLSRADLIRAYLIAHYKNFQVPKGVQQDLAVMFGVSRQRVQQIMAEMHFYVMPVPKPEPKYKCAKCGKPTNYRRGCLPCRTTEIPCAFCAKPVVRSMAQMANRAEKRRGSFGGYTGKHVFCDRTCMGKWLANEYGFVAHPEHATMNRTTKHERLMRQWRALTGETEEAS